MKTGQEEFPEASLSDVKEEMATPRMAQSVRQAMSPRFLCPARGGSPVLFSAGREGDSAQAAPIYRNIATDPGTMIGTTRSRVNFFMNKFRMLGFIKYPGSLDANGGLCINTSLLAKAFHK